MKRQLTDLAPWLKSSSEMLIVSVWTEGNVAFLGRSVGWSSHLHSLVYRYLNPLARIVPMVATYINMIGIPPRAYNMVTILPMGVLGTRLPYPIVVKIARLNIRLLLNVHTLSSGSLPRKLPHKNISPFETNACTCKSISNSFYSWSLESANDLALHSEIKH